jgi:serine phosphatase RsbU (regulator of sigma subunit)
MKKYFLAFLFFIGIIQISFAQDKKPETPVASKVKDIRDSVRIILSMPESKVKAKYLSQLGDIYRFSNADSAIFYFSLSEKIALKLNYENFLPAVHKDLSFVYSRLKSNYSRSLYYAILSKKDHEAVGIFDPSDDFGIMQEYAYMGSKTKVEKLLEIIKPAVISGNFKTNTLSKGTLLGLIGEAYLKINELDSALKYSSWGLRIPEKNKWPYIYYVLAKTHLDKKDYEKSLDYIHKGLPIIKASKREKNIAQVYACAANDYFGLNNIDSSIYYSRLAYNLGVKNSITEVILNSSQLLFRIYKQQSKFDSAFKYLQITSALKDTLAQQNKINDIDNISLNESIREQEKAEQESQKNKFIIGFALIFILSFSALYIYNRNKQKESIRKIEDDRKNKELKAAQDFQNSLLPKHLPKRADLDIATYIRSSTEVGGDYFDFFNEDSGLLISVCGDATGHGVASGMMVSVTKTALNGLASLKPNQMLNRLNSVIKKVDLGILRMSLNVVEFGKNEFTLSSAAMPPIYFYNSKEGLLEEFSNNGLPLGSLRNEEYVLEKRKFREGDVLVQFSDGLPEAPNLAGELYDYERLKSLVQNSCHLSANEIIDTLVKSVDEWMQGQPNPDDITLVVTKKK